MNPVHRTLAASLAAFALNAHAGPVYDYTGNLFTTVTGTAPTVTTSNRISGWVEFGTAPTAAVVGKNDVIAWLLSDGVRTFSSAAGNALFQTSFDFDAALAISHWSLLSVPVAENNNANAINTMANASSALDISRMGSGQVQNATVTSPGTWVLRDAETVPEPDTLALGGLSLALLAAATRRGHVRRGTQRLATQAS